MAATLTVNFVGDTSHLSKSFKTAEKDAQSFGGKVKGHVGIGMGSIIKGAGLASIALIGAQSLKSAFSAIIGDYSDHNKAAKQTEAVLKSTGHAAGVSKDQIIAHADAIEKLSGQDDVAVQAGENMLLTFTNIKNRVGEGKDTFNQATQAMADLSAATGKSMTVSATMLGKALNDPIKGIGALSRVGVQFDDDQKKLIKTYVKHGETAKAQAVILKELQKEFGGSAKAAGETLSGKLDILKARFFDMTGALMEKVMPAITKLVGWLADNTPAAVEKLEKVFAAASEFISGVWKRWGDDIKAITKHVMDAFGPILKSGFEVLKTEFKIIGDLLQGRWGDAWDEIKKLPMQALKYMDSILRGGGALLGAAAKSVGSAVFNKIKEGFGDLGGWILDKAKAALNWIITRFNSAVHLKVSVDTHIPGLGRVGIDIDPPDIPTFGNGGIVTRPTLAVIGEKGPEAVVPLSGGSSGFGTTIVFNQTPASADPNAIAAAVAWRLRTVSV
jgi:hypothetical protein